MNKWLVSVFFVFALCSNAIQDQLPGCTGLDTFMVTIDYVFSTRVLSTRAVSSLDECLKHCATSSSCLAANFYSIRSSTSPICELLSTRKNESIENRTQNGHVFPLYYAERICLSNSHSCSGKQWAFELVPKTRLQEIKSLVSSVLEEIENSTMQECLEKCLEILSCKAAIVNRHNGSSETSSCQLIALNRHTVKNPKHYFKFNESFDMYESNCGNETLKDSEQMKEECLFFKERSRSKLRMPLYDNRMIGIQSSDHCHHLCHDRLGSSCRSFMFDHDRKSCYISHSREQFSRANAFPTLDEVVGSEITSAELDDCVQFDLNCSPSDLTVTVSTSRMFRGSFGIMEEANNSCKIDIDNEQQFQLTINYDECKVKKEASGFYSTVVSLKYGSSRLITYRDRQVKLVCRNLVNKSDDITVTAQLHVRNESAAETETRKEPTVIVAKQSAQIGIGDYSLRILDVSMRDTTKVRPGDEGHLEVTRIRSNPIGAMIPHDIIITDLVATEARSGADIQLLDENGCPLHKDVSPFAPTGDGQWRSRIRFYGLNETYKGRIRFTGTVRPCTSACSVPKDRCKLEEKTRKFPTRAFPHEILSKRTALQIFA